MNTLELIDRIRSKRHLEILCYPKYFRVTIDAPIPVMAENPDLLAALMEAARVAGV